MKTFYEKDAEVNLIKEKKIAIFGYGSQGHAHALNLKDSGVKEVVVALREGSSSIKKAESEGLKVMTLSDAAAWADVVMMLTPDELQSEIYKNHIEQRMKEGTSLAFAHGLNIHFDLNDSFGKSFTSHEIMGEKGILIVFTCNHCPYAIAIWKRLIELYPQIQPDIGMIAINPNIHPDYPQDSAESMQQKVLQDKIPFPYLVDEQQLIAKQYQAQLVHLFFQLFH